MGARLRLRPADLERAQHGRHSAPGNGVLYVFALVGRGPYKEETVELPSTVSLLIADRILSATTQAHAAADDRADQGAQGGRLVQPDPTVHVSVDGQPGGPTDTITDVGQLAVQQYEAIYPAGDRPGPWSAASSRRGSSTRARRRRR